MLVIPPAAQSHQQRPQPIVHFGTRHISISLSDFPPSSHDPIWSANPCCQLVHKISKILGDCSPCQRLSATAAAGATTTRPPSLSAQHLLPGFLKSLVIARILRHQPPIQVEWKPGRAPRHHQGGGQVVLSGKLADQSRLLLRRGSQRSVGQLLLVMDVVQHEDRLSRKTRSLTLEPASLQGSLSTANRNHVQPDSQIARKGTFKSWLLFFITTRPFHIESKLIGYLAEVLGLLVPAIKVVQGKS